MTFDTVFSAFRAFHSAGFIFGGIICIGIAALILFSNIQTQKRFRQVKGTIAGVRRHKRTMKHTQQHTETTQTYYYPVYEYVDTNGDKVQAHSTSGSTSLYDKVIGTPVMLWVNPEEPLDVKAHNPKLTAFFIIIFLLPGFGFSYLGLANSGTSLPAIIMVFLLFGIPLFKLARSIKPRSEWETPSEFKQRRMAARRKILENPAGEILSIQELQVLLKKEDKNMRVGAVVVTLLALGFLTGGQWLAYDMERFTIHADKKPGKVIEISERARKKDGELRYYPVVEFTTSENETRSFKSGRGSNPSHYRIGDEVTVLYNAKKPRVATIDKGLLKNEPAMVCYGFGILLMFGALRCWSAVRKRAESARFFR